MKCNNAILTKLAKNVFTQTSFLINGKPVENIEIVQFDTDDNVVFVIAEDCRFLIQIEKTSVTTKSVTVNWHLYHYRDDEPCPHLATGKTGFVAGKDFKP